MRRAASRARAGTGGGRGQPHRRWDRQDAARDRARRRAGGARLASGFREPRPRPGRRRRPDRARGRPGRPGRRRTSAPGRDRATGRRRPRPAGRRPPARGARPPVRRDRRRRRPPAPPARTRRRDRGRRRLARPGQRLDAARGPAARAGVPARRSRRGRTPGRRRGLARVRDAGRARDPDDPRARGLAEPRPPRTDGGSGRVPAGARLGDRGCRPSGPVLRAAGAPGHRRADPRVSRPPRLRAGRPAPARRRRDPHDREGRGKMRAFRGRTLLGARHPRPDRSGAPPGTPRPSWRPARSGSTPAAAASPATARR